MIGAIIGDTVNGMYKKQKNLYLLSMLSIEKCGVSLFWDDKEKEN